jgi:hypothetical protein
MVIDSCSYFPAHLVLKSAIYHHYLLANLCCICLLSVCAKPRGECSESFLFAPCVTCRGCLIGSPPLLVCLRFNFLGVHFNWLPIFLSAATSLSSLASTNTSATPNLLHTATALPITVNPHQPHNLTIRNRQLKQHG